MRCKDAGKRCSTCVHYKKKYKKCSKSHWLDMIGLAKGIKPDKSLYTYSFRRK